jgi:protein-disulfide isomerase
MDMKRIDADMATDEARIALDESLNLGQTLGLNGTPSYIIGSDVVIGAVGLDALRSKVSTARCGKAVC